MRFRFGSGNVVHINPNKIEKFSYFERDGYGNHTVGLTIWLDRRDRGLDFVFRTCNERQEAVNHIEEVWEK